MLESCQKWKKNLFSFKLLIRQTRLNFWSDNFTATNTPRDSINEKKNN